MGFYSPIPVQDLIQTWIRNWLIAVLPANTPVLSGSINRIPEPNGEAFVIFSVLFRTRLATNEYSYADCSFLAEIDTASMSSAAMTVSEVLLGSLTVGNQLFGPGAPPGAVITGQATGMPGGAGTYSVLPVWDVPPGTKLACGARGIQESTEVHVQIDTHSAQPLESGDMVQTIAQLWRSEAAADYWTAMTGGQAQVLYADEPMSLPFENAEQQSETRWVTTLRMQVNSLITLPQDFADQLTPTILLAQAQGSQEGQI